MTVSSASRPDPLLEVVVVGAGELVVLLGLDPLRPDAPLEALDHLVRLLVRHDVRHLYLGAAGDHVEDAGPELAGDPLLGGTLELLAHGGRAARLASRTRSPP